MALPPELHKIGLRELRLPDATTRLGNRRGLPGNQLVASKGDHVGRYGAAPRVLFRGQAAQIHHDLDRAEHAIGERLAQEVTHSALNISQIYSILDIKDMTCRYYCHSDIHTCGTTE